MKILITGASGLIGKALQDSFRQKGHDMLLASRREPRGPDEIKWDIENGFADPKKLEGVDAVVHLAGENVSGGLRWSEEKKRAIRESRIVGTKSVVDAMAAMSVKPKVFIASSAIGFYGDRADEIMTESSSAGTTFLSEVSTAWEAESRRAEDAGIRTVLLRTGIVLAKDGGALAAMLTPFKFGVGGVVGSGKQWMSWISLDDMVGLINFCIEHESIRGAVNAVAPNPVTNAEFTKAMGEVLYRPTFLPLPAFAVNMVFGEMGDALLLASTRVIPKRLEDAGYKFQFTDIREAIAHAVK
jgi:uncharacterized protein (TIGR01777 family)